MNADTATHSEPSNKAGVGDTVFLTGATGFLGSEIMKRLLEAHPGSRLALLVRSTPRETARERVDKLLASLEKLRETVST